MAESNINTDVIDVQRELDQIKSLGKAIAAVLIDGAQIDRDDLGELGYLISDLVKQVENKLCEQVRLLSEQWEKRFAEQINSLRLKADSQPQAECSSGEGDEDSERV